MFFALLSDIVLAGCALSVLWHFTVVPMLKKKEEENEKLKRENEWLRRDV